MVKWNLNSVDRFFDKYSNKKLHERISSCSMRWDRLTDRQTWHDRASGRFWQFWERVYKCESIPLRYRFFFCGRNEHCSADTSGMPRLLYPRERPGTHFIGGWVGPRAGLDGRKISSPPEFDPRTVQPVASPYNYWAIPAPVNQSINQSIS